MRIAPILLAVVLLAAMVPAPASSATKYKPCTLLTTADLEGALKAKLSRAQQEGGDVEDDGPLKGETLDWCSWIFVSGSDAIGVVLRVTRAVAPVPQMAEAWYGPLVDTAKKGGGTVESVKLAGTECHIFRNKNKSAGPVGNSTNCLTAGKGRALTIEINTPAATPVPPAVAQGLLAKAVARLP
jgi:hypothetical protein